MRASQAPEQWQLVLDAVNADDYELANKLAVKFKFASEINQEKEMDYNNVRHEPLKGDFVAQSPEGDIYCHESGARLSVYLGLSPTYVVSAIHRLVSNNGVSKSGKLKGWRFWRET